MEVPEELRVAIELAQRTAAGKGRVATFAQEMANLLARVEKRLASAETGISVSRTARGSVDRVEYIVESDSNRQETLAEHRTNGKSKPFRCSKGLYEAIVAVLAAADRSLSVEEIAAGVEPLGHDRPAEFQVRVPLRLWMHIQPPLITRNRARYRIVSSTSFAADGKSLWEQLSTSRTQK